MRPWQWLVALMLSVLIHAGALYQLSLTTFVTTPTEREELSFTVLLAERSVLDQLVLEPAEGLPSEEIPLISLEDLSLSELSSELLAPMVGEELLPAMPEPLEPEGDLSVIELESEPLLPPPTATAVVVPLPEAAVITLDQEEAVSIDSALSLPQLPTDIPFMTPQELVAKDWGDSPPTVEMLPPLEPPIPDEEVVSEALPLPRSEPVPLPQITSLTASALALPIPTPERLELPQAVDQGREILAEITIEQLEFDRLEMAALPTVRAHDLGSAGAAALLPDSADWRLRYRGAAGVPTSYSDTMRVTLKQFTLYPKAVAEELKIEGKVVIGFTINRQGYLMGSEILVSSGHEALDQAVEKMIEYAQPFVRLPEEVAVDQVRFAFPVTIRLQR